MPSWSRVATRLRVPLGFAFAAAYLRFAHPNWISIAAGTVVASVGLLIRAAASGHIRKNAQLTTTGPYAYVRNPLYLGSILIAVGFIIAARNWWIGLAALAMFAFIYIPVVRAEEIYLRSVFPEFENYCAHFSRFFPSLTAYASHSPIDSAGVSFSRQFNPTHRCHMPLRPRL